MRKSLQLLGCLAILAVPMIALPVHAQSTGNGSPNADTGKPADHGVWREHHGEMEQLRAEREQIESDRDSLKQQCMDAKGQDRSSCEEKMKALHDRMEAMHAKMQALHEKMEADRHDRHEHHGQWKAKHEQNGTSGKGSAPSGTTPSTEQ